MKLLLIRHGETEHNVAGLLFDAPFPFALIAADSYRAGVTDSRLTNHGVLQTQRLGQYFAEQGTQLTHIFASDLSRAYLTAKALADAQAEKWPASDLEVVKLSLLREQDFGSLEGTPWASRRENGYERSSKHFDDENFVPKETHQSMRLRAESFWDDHILPLLALNHDRGPCIAVVSHGLFLSMLWPSFLERLGPDSIMLGPGISSDTAGRPLHYLPAWSNTGFLELDMIPKSTNTVIPVSDILAEPLVGVDEDPSHEAPLRAWQVIIRTINGRNHLNNLKRTGGGVGSAAYDAKQKSLDGFFKKSQAQS